MSDMAALSAIRAYLIKENLCPRVHLSLPPHAAYPLALIELEEVCPNYPVENMSIDFRLKFKVGLYADIQGFVEVMQVSEKVREGLDGVALPLPAGKLLVVKFLACEKDKATGSRSDAPLQVINQYYEAIVRTGVGKENA